MVRPPSGISRRHGAVCAYTEAGSDEACIGQVGGHYEGFFEFYVGRVLPLLRES